MRFGYARKSRYTVRLYSVFLGGSFRNSGHNRAWRTACTCSCPNSYRRNKIYAVDRVTKELLRSSNSEFWREEKQYPGVVRLGHWNSMHLTYGFIHESAEILFVQESSANVHCRFFSACSGWITRHFEVCPFVRNGLPGPSVFNSTLSFFIVRNGCNINFGIVGPLK